MWPDRKGDHLMRHLHHCTGNVSYYFIGWIIESLNWKARSGHMKPSFHRSAIQSLRLEGMWPESLGARVGLELMSSDLVSDKFCTLQASSGSWVDWLCCWKVLGLVKLSDSRSFWERVTAQATLQKLYAFLAGIVMLGLDHAAHWGILPMEDLPGTGIQLTRTQWGGKK